MDLKATRCDVDNGIATITLSRPERRNAWTGRMHSEYRHLLAQLDADRAVRVIVVTGDPAGNAFCAGADLGGLEKMSEQGEYDPGISDDIATPGYGVNPAFDAAFAYHFGLTKPVIAAVNGPAAGVGLVLAAFADLRFATSGAKFTAAHGRFNFPVEYGLSWLLPRIIGLARANDILLSSRVFLAEEALEMGFVNQVHDQATLMDAVYDYAGLMAATVSPGSLRESRRQIYSDQHRSLAESVADSERLLREMARHLDYAEGLRAWQEKRKPNWSEE
jgi:enoyl-CoA hydratase/carnithine racemase